MIDSDAIFYYGEDPEQDIQNDIILGLGQDARTLFFNRSDSAGVSQISNSPNSFSLQVLAKFYISSWIAYRNGYVSQEKPDMRIATSQSVIEITQEEDKVSIQIQYIRFENRIDLNTVEVRL